MANRRILSNTLSRTLDLHQYTESPNSSTPKKTIPNRSTLTSTIFPKPSRPPFRSCPIRFPSRSTTTTPLSKPIQQVDLTNSSSLLEHRRGVTFTARSPDGRHALAAEAGLRDLSPRRHPSVPYAYAASLGIVADAGRPSTKTSLKYTFTDDARDDPFVPAMGSYLQASLEGAGALGVFVHFKIYFGVVFDVVAQGLAGRCQDRGGGDGAWTPRGKREPCHGVKAGNLSADAWEGCEWCHSSETRAGAV